MSACHCATVSETDAAQVQVACTCTQPRPTSWRRRIRKMRTPGVRARAAGGHVGPGRARPATDSVVTPPARTVARRSWRRSCYGRASGCTRTRRRCCPTHSTPPALAASTGPPSSPGGPAAASPLGSSVTTRSQGQLGSSVSGWGPLPMSRRWPSCVTTMISGRSHSDREPPHPGRHDRAAS